MPSTLKFSVPPVARRSVRLLDLDQYSQALLRTIRLCITVSLRAPLSDSPTPSGRGTGLAHLGHVGVVVVVDVVVHQHPARMGVGDRADAVVRTCAVLRRRGIVVLAVGVEAVLVVVEFRVLDHQLAAGVGPGVAECVELGVGPVDRLVAPLLAGADVVAGVGEVAGVRLEPAAPGPGARKDPVVRRGVVRPVERARRAQVRADVPVATDLAAAVACRSTRSRCRRCHGR